MAELKVRVTLGDTTVKGTLDELIESGIFKMEYDQAELDEIVKEKYEVPSTVYVASGCFASRPKDGDGLTGWVPVLLYTLKKKEDANA